MVVFLPLPVPRERVGVRALSFEPRPEIRTCEDPHPCPLPEYRERGARFINPAVSNRGIRPSASVVDLCLDHTWRKRKGPPEDESGGPGFVLARHRRTPYRAGRTSASFSGLLPRTARGWADGRGCVPRG